MKNKLMEDLTTILTENPMSDEDKRDSDILKNIFQKRSKRSNAKLTSDEQAVLDKYGIIVMGKDILGSDGESLYTGRYGKDNEAGSLALTGGRTSRNKVNFADMARKRPERRYAQSVNMDFPDRLTSGYGKDTKTLFHFGDDYSFDARERSLNTKNSKYQKDLNDAKEAARSRKRYNRLANDTYDDEERANLEYQRLVDQAESEYKNAEQIYNNRIEFANRSRDAQLDWAKNKRQEFASGAEEATSRINSIKDKYRRK